MPYVVDKTDEMKVLTENDLKPGLDNVVEYEFQVSRIAGISSILIDNRDKQIEVVRKTVHQEKPKKLTAKQVSRLKFHFQKVMDQSKTERVLMGMNEDY